MGKFGFGEKFIEWIKFLYEQSKSTVITNGILGPLITMHRGIKQGCPLAAFLYILYIEPLHLVLQKELKGIRIGRTTLKTSGFIDDVAIFLSRDEDITKSVKILERFEELTNGKLNKEKKITTIGKMGKHKEMAITLAKVSFLRQKC